VSGGCCNSGCHRPAADQRRHHHARSDTRDDDLADPENAYTAEVATSGIYVAILGQQYGRRLPTRFSATHTEYNFAEEQGLRICVYPLDVSDREGHEQKFLDDIWQFHTAPIVTRADLPAAVVRRLRQIAAEDLSPWCKLGPNVLRTSSVQEAGDEIIVTSRVRNRDVAHALDQMRKDNWSTFEGDFTWDGRCEYVRVASIATTTTASTARSYRLVLERRENRRSSGLEWSSFNGKSAEEWTEIAVKSSLFGEANPLRQQHMEFMADIGDPLAPLRGVHISEEIVRPVVHLLLTEALVGGGRASRLTSLRLGVALSGRRNLQLVWEAPGRYTNERPSRHQVSGILTLA
jgi:hypothetical protein